MRVPKSRRVVVTGMGAVSPLGTTIFRGGFHPGVSFVGDGPS